MGTLGRLIDIFQQLNKFTCEEAIFAKKPWTQDSPALVLIVPETPDLPEEATKLGLSYLLEIDLAQDFLEDWVAAQDHDPTYLEQCERLIHYAIYDA